MSGSGQVTLGGDNSYSGNTNVSGGVLTITGSMGAGGYSLTGGTINFSGQQTSGSPLDVGNGAGTTGTFNITGGSVTIGTYYGTIVGQGGTGVMNVSGGTFTENTNTAMALGNGGNGTLIISGSGAVVVNGTSYLWLARGSAASAGTIDLNGGVLATARSITQDTTQTLGTGIVNFNGGTLEALADNTALISAITSATSKRGERTSTPTATT